MNYDALVRRNALRCETARYPRCRCYCAGALHGARHSEAWIAALVALLSRAAEIQFELDFGEVDDAPGEAEFRRDS